MRTRRAFSLLEVLLAIGLIVLLGGSVVGFVFELAERRSVLLAHSRRLVAADAMMEAIEGDVFTSLAGDARRGAGVRGDATSLRVLSRSVMLGMQRARGRMELDDLRSTEYRFDSTRGVVTAARASVLFADEQGGGREVILEGVERVRFRYYDGQEWLTRFDSNTAGRLPAAIEIGVWFAPVRAGVADKGFASTEGAESLVRSDEENERDEISHLENLSEPEEEEGLEKEGDEGEEENLPTPDRLRIIVVPDAGEAGAEGGAW